MKHPQQPGIYAITHVPTGRRYVGSTLNLRNRLAVHRSNLRGAKHFSRHLQNAWNKYGEATFRFEVLEVCLGGHELLLAREQYWIDRQTKELFNKRLIASSTKGCKLNLSREERKRRADQAREVFKANPRPLQTHAHLKAEDIPVILECYAGGEGIKSLARRYGVWTNTVIDVIRRKTWGVIAVDDSLAARCMEKVGRMGRKLAPDDVREIRRRHALGEYLKYLAIAFNVSPPTIKSVVTRTKYAWVD